MKILLVFCQCVLLTQAKYNYSEALSKSILFYEAQRSGVLPANNRIPWRWESALEDGQDHGLDLTGGWYDAGDHVKFGFPIAFAVTTLAWGVVEFRAGYEAAGELTNVLDSIKWPLDYFIKCHVSDNEFYAQVGDGLDDHAYWGRPEQMTMFRPSWQINSSAPGSDLAGETAAAMAASSMAFNQTDPSYARMLLRHARTLYDLAYNFRGFYSDHFPTPRKYYCSSCFTDELAYGAAWLYRATGEQQYLDKALEFYNRDIAWAFSWDLKDAGTQLVLYAATKDPTYARDVERFLRSWMPGGSVPYTQGGLAYRHMWACLRYAANSAFIAIAAEQHGIMSGEARNWGKTQIDYILGDNPNRRSYVVGFGRNPPVRPHHRAASCPSDPNERCRWASFASPDPNPNVINGALVGGPDVKDRYMDDRTNYFANEVSCDSNAGFQGALAGLLATRT